MLALATTLLFFAVGFGYPVLSYRFRVDAGVAMLIACVFTVGYVLCVIALHPDLPNHVMLEMATAIPALVLGFACAIPTVMHMMWQRGRDALAEMERTGEIEEFRRRFGSPLPGESRPEPHLWHDLGHWILQLPCRTYPDLR